MGLLQTLSKTLKSLQNQLAEVWLASGHQAGHCQHEPRRSSNHMGPLAPGKGIGIRNLGIGLQSLIRRRAPKLAPNTGVVQPPFASRVRWQASLA